METAEARVAALGDGFGLCDRDERGDRRRAFVLAGSTAEQGVVALLAARFIPFIAPWYYSSKSGNGALNDCLSVNLNALHFGQ